ncbi:hypothetical protein [Halotalea alkalilenta]|nr:hypothetical protein [Halotalea alkalilenta]
MSQLRLHRVGADSLFPLPCAATAARSGCDRLGMRDAHPHGTLAS